MRRHRLPQQMSRVGAAPVLAGGAAEEFRVQVDARRPAIENSAFVVDGGRIVAVGARGAVHAPADAMHVDLSGKTVIPALIDTHIHIGYQKDLVYSADNYTRANLTDQLHRYAYAA